MVRRRNFDVQFCSMHNSGSHWLKYSLGVGISCVYGLELPEHIQSDRLIGHPKNLPQPHPGLPVIVHSHSLPNLLLRSPFIHRAMNAPKYMFLVRNIERSLYSCFVKWRTSYPDYDFRRFIHDGPFGKGVISGLWLEIIFYNSWGKMLQANPEQVMAVRYEDIQKDFPKEYFRAWKFLGLKEMSEDQFSEVLRLTTKEEMAKHPNPDVSQTVVRSEMDQSPYNLSDEDRAYIHNTCRSYLEHDFGYQY